MLMLQNLDYVAILAYLLLMAFVGVLFGRLVKDSGSYFKGGGAIPWIMAAVTNFMGLFSTFVFIAYAGIAYEHGLVAMTVLWGFVPACIIGGILAKRWRRVGKTSPMEYLETRYNFNVRQTMTWAGLVMRFLDNMVRLYAIGILITAATPLPFVWAIVISGLIVTGFNLFGGIWSVSFMSTIQFVILILITIVLLPLSLGEAGGLSVLADKLPEHLKWFNGPKGNLFWLGVFYIMSIIKQNENWTFIQKFYCVRDEKAARNVGLFTALLFLVTIPVFLLPTVVAPVIVPGLENPEMSYVVLSVKLLPVGIMGIMFSSLFASTMSTLNAEFNVMSGVVTHDIYLRLLNPNATDRQTLVVARLSTVVIGVIITLGAIAINGTGVFEINKLFSGIMAIPLGIPLLFGIISKRPAGPAATLTIILGVLIGVIVNLIHGLSWEAGTLIEILLCLLIYFFPYRVRMSEEKQTELKGFFNQLSTPIEEKDKPEIATQYKKVLSSLFIFSFVVAGFLFCITSLPSLGSLGGKYSFIAGSSCFVFAAILGFMKRRKNKSDKTA